MKCSWRKAISFSAVVAGAVVLAVCAGAAGEDSAANSAPRTGVPSAGDKDCGEPISPEVIDRLDREEDVTSEPEPVAALESWLKWGGDARYRMYIEENIRLDGSSPRTRRRFWHRPRVRVWSEVQPVKNLSVRSRILYEPRYFCEPDLPQQLIFNEGVIDQLYVLSRQTFGLPLTLKVGRQDIKLGDGWLIREGTPRDGGRSFYFEAARATWDFKDACTSLDLIYIQNYADSAKYIKPFNDADRDLIEQDERGAIVYLTNRQLPKTRLEAYFIYKHADAVASNGYDADLYTFGGLAAGEIGPRWRYKFEAAGQFGRKNGESVTAMGSNNRIACFLGDAWDTKLHFDYEYRSGDRDPNSNFDVLWGRATQFSNLYNYYISVLEGQMAMSSNLHRFGPGISVQPLKQLYLGVNYDFLFRDHKSGNYDSQGEFRGQLLTVKAQYDITKDMSLRLLYDLFLPDSFYGPRNDTVSFIQIQYAFRW